MEHPVTPQSPVELTVVWPPQFPAARSCRSCPLWESAKNVGIPTRIFRHDPNRPKLNTALLVIGEKPGYAEDLCGKHFVGETGEILNLKLLKASKIRDLADVYLVNAVRCKPPKNATVTEKQLKACTSEHLWPEIEWLIANYERVVILGAGAGAAKVLRGSSLDACFSHQGHPTTQFELPTFWTFNPFILHPSRDPSKLDAVVDHLTLLKEWLETGSLATTLELPEYLVAPGQLGVEGIDPPGFVPKRLSLDIESFGAVEGLPTQTVFQPQRAILTDGCPADQLVQTVALSWRNSREQFVSAIYNVQNPEHARQLEMVLADCVGRGAELIGMNLPFDLMFLRAGGWKSWFTRGQWVLRDLGVINYLYSEVRPERSLKNISPLLNVTNYDDEPVNLRKGERYESPSDPRLWAYNCKDAVATLDAFERIESDLRRDYGSTNKLSPYSVDWYDHLLWFAIESSESGCTIDPVALQALHDRLEYQAGRLLRKATEWWEARLAGTGSVTWISSVVTAAADEANVLDDPRLKRTDKKNEISTSIENINLLLELLPKSSRLWNQLKTLAKYREKSKMLQSFTGPLLLGRRKGTKRIMSGVLLGNRVFPTWHIVPSQYEDASSGGTKQGRIVCRNPAVMTFPELIKQCMSTRFTPGYLLGDDESQVELRTAALLSGDPIMVHEYQVGIDRHLQQAAGILKSTVDYALRGGFDRDVRLGGFTLQQMQEFLDAFEAGQADKHWPGITIWRQLGKTLNFLMLFYGGAAKAQETAARDLGLILPLQVWELAIKAYRTRYPLFLEYQHGLMKEARRKKFLEVPLTGQTRMFLGGHKGVASSINEVVNFPIQTVAANAMISAHREAVRLYREEGLRAVSNLIIYDAMYIECPADEKDRVTQIQDHAMVNAPYWKDIEQLLGRTVPLEHDLEVLCERL